MASVSAAPVTVRGKSAAKVGIGDVLHRVFITTAACVIGVTIVYLAVHGFPYYTLSLEERPFSPLHAQLRSSGVVGLRLAFTSVGMFCLLFLYPLRKRWTWLSRIGSTRRWLNFHVLMGIATPMMVTFHTSFRMHGLAGLAYWTMIAVALSGFVGRYVYAKIPRGRTAAELSMKELEQEAGALTAHLREQPFFREEDLAPLLAMPSAQEIRRMSLLAGLWIMLRHDLARPFMLSRLRRRALGGTHSVATLGGLLASHDARLESVVAMIRRQSRLRLSIAFLDRTEKLFHLWHVVHRPFSISFVMLITVHIAVAMSMGVWSWRIH